MVKYQQFSLAVFWVRQRFNITLAEKIAAHGTVSIPNTCRILTSILIGLPDLLPSGHGRDSPIAAIAGIICGLTLVMLVGIGLYLVALLRQSGRISLEQSYRDGSSLVL